MTLRIIQRGLSELIREIYIMDPISIGEFTTKYLEDILPKHKEELGLDFDKLIVYPSQQPRESADIELYKEGRLIKKISVKTAVTGRIEPHIRALKKDAKNGMDGMLILYTKFQKNGKTLRVVMIVFLIDKSALINYPTRAIVSEISDRLERKEIEEKVTIKIILINEALMFELAYNAIKSRELAEENRRSINELKNLFIELKEAIEANTEKMSELINLLKKLLEKLQ